MKYNEFLEIVEMLNIAYRAPSRGNGLLESGEIKLYYDCLKGLKFEELKMATLKCLKNEIEFPSIGTIREYYAREIYWDWSIEWVSYLNDKAHKLNEPAGHAIKVLSPEYINDMIRNKNGGMVASEFKELYEDYCKNNIEC